MTFELRRKIGPIGWLRCVLFHGGNRYEEWVTTNRGLTFQTRALSVRACGTCGRVKFQRRLVIDGEELVPDAG